MVYLWIIFNKSDQKINIPTENKHVGNNFSFAHFLIFTEFVHKKYNEEDKKKSNRMILLVFQCCWPHTWMHYSLLLIMAPHLYTLPRPPEWSPQDRYNYLLPSPWWTDSYTLCCSPASPGFLDTEEQEWFWEKLSKSRELLMWKWVILGDSDGKSEEITERVISLTCSRYIAWCRFTEISNGIFNPPILKQEIIRFNPNQWKQKIFI